MDQVCGMAIRASLRRHTVRWTRTLPVVEDRETELSAVIEIAPYDTAWPIGLEPRSVLRRAVAAEHQYQHNDDRTNDQEQAKADRPQSQSPASLCPL
jgi:hypothetical protein